MRLCSTSQIEGDPLKTNDTLASAQYPRICRMKGLQTWELYLFVNSY